MYVSLDIKHTQYDLYHKAKLYDLLIGFTSHELITEQFFNSFKEMNLIFLVIINSRD